VPRADSLDSLVARIAGGTASADELHAFREAIAQGRSRWGRASPFAVEIVARGAADLRALELLGRRAGSCDVLEDERGRSVVRVEVERIPTAVRGRVVPAFHQFAQRAIGRKHASVWIAGWKLPPRAIVLWL
jgi:hypothetical protein